MTAALAPQREAVHHPEYVYCSYPDYCCHTYHPVAIVCAVDQQHWPCATKLSHHTEAQGAKLRRWVDGRIGRAPMRAGSGDVEP